MCISDLRACAQASLFYPEQQTAGCQGKVGELVSTCCMPGTMTHNPPRQLAQSSAPLWVSPLFSLGEETASLECKKILSQCSSPAAAILGSGPVHRATLTGPRLQTRVCTTAQWSLTQWRTSPLPGCPCQLATQENIRRRLGVEGAFISTHNISINLELECSSNAY